jgi:hypothetical protein
MSLWFAVVVFVDKLSVCGVLLKYLWCNCLCHLWWHRQLGHKIFINTDSWESMRAICLGHFWWHRQFGTVEYTVEYCRAEVE